MRACQDSSRSIAPPSPRGFPRTGGVRAAIDSDRLGDGPFNLARLVVGSEGSLVVVTEATVRSGSRCRERRRSAVGHFASVADAIAATEDALSTRPSAVELIDRTILELSRQKLEYSALGSILVGDPGALLFVTFDGGDAAEASAGVERIAALWQRNGHGYHTLRATNPQQAALLKVRSAGLGLLMAASEGTRRPVAFIRGHGCRPGPPTESTCGVSAPSWNGTASWPASTVTARRVLHIRPFMDLTRPDEVATMRTVRHRDSRPGERIRRPRTPGENTATGSLAASSTAASSATRFYGGRMCELKLLFEPALADESGKDRQRAPR